MKIPIDSVAYEKGSIKSGEGLAVPSFSAVILFSPMTTTPHPFCRAGETEPQPDTTGRIGLLLTGPR